MREWRGSTRCSQCVSDKTFLHREKHFGWRGVTRLEDTTGFGPHNSAKRANVSHSSGLLTSSLQCVYTVSQGWEGYLQDTPDLTGLLEAGVTAPVSHDRKE